MFFMKFGGVETIIYHIFAFFKVVLIQNSEI